MTEAKYFSDFKQGECFAYRHGLYIKTESMALMGPHGDLPRCAAGSRFNCVDLVGGMLNSVDGDELVIPQPAYGAPV